MSVKQRGESFYYEYTKFVSQITYVYLLSLFLSKLTARDSNDWITALTSLLH